jgi:hypothetical protein
MGGVQVAWPGSSETNDLCKKNKDPIPKLYRDEPGTVVEPLDSGYESVKRPDGTTVVRKTLSRSTKRKHAMLKTLAERGWQVKSISGGGRVVHPKHPDIVNASIAAAALIEFGADWVRDQNKAN